MMPDAIDKIGRDWIGGCVDLKTGPSNCPTRQDRFKGNYLTLWNCQPNKWHQPHLFVSSKAAVVAHGSFADANGISLAVWSFEAKLLQRARMTIDVVFQTAETSTVRGQKDFCVWEAEELQQPIGKSFDTVPPEYRRSSLNRVWNECPPYKYHFKLQTFAKKPSSAILQPSFRIMTIDYIVFKNSPLGGRMSVSQIACTAWQPLEMARKQQNLQNFLDFFFWSRQSQVGTSWWNTGTDCKKGGTATWHDSFQIGPHSFMPHTILLLAESTLKLCIVFCHFVSSIQVSSDLVSKVDPKVVGRCITRLMPSLKCKQEKSQRWLFSPAYQSTRRSCDASPRRLHGLPKTTATKVYWCSLKCRSTPMLQTRERERERERKKKVRVSIYVQVLMPQQPNCNNTKDLHTIQESLYYVRPKQCTLKGESHKTCVHKSHILRTHLQWRVAFSVLLVAWCPKSFRSLKNTWPRKVAAMQTYTPSRPSCHGSDWAKLRKQ